MERSDRLHNTFIFRETSVIDTLSLRNDFFAQCTNEELEENRTAGTDKKNRERGKDALLHCTGYAVFSLSVNQLGISASYSSAAVRYKHVSFPELNDVEISSISVWLVALHNDEKNEFSWPLLLARQNSAFNLCKKPLVSSVMSEQTFSQRLQFNAVKIIIRDQGGIASFSPFCLEQFLICQTRVYSISLPERAVFQIE
jgi:hypothetical protein